MIHVGTCSWTEKSLIESGEFYPKSVRTAESRLQFYANAYLQLSSLYTQATWQIAGDEFVVKAPGSRLTLALQYWQLRADQLSSHKTIRGWRTRIDDFLRESVADLRFDIPKSFAA